MKIPYGVSNFDQIRTKGYFYADKTHFLPVLEEHYQYVVFLRPRRFGKSTLLSMLEHYYDVGQKDRFDALFQGLWVHQNPTSERNSYLVLRLDFSAVGTDRGQETLLRTFLSVVRQGVERLISAHRERIPELVGLQARLDTFLDAEVMLSSLMTIVYGAKFALYVLIDEYDHFANRLLAADGADLYETVVKKTGFVRTFYATLKVGTSLGAIARIFITGVSPLMLDDLSSGFNIARHASLAKRLNTLVGFTRAETEAAVDEFLAARPELAALPEVSDRDILLKVLEKYYNGYRFAEAAAERVFNSDMVLYFLKELDQRGQYPANMLDQNVRTEYSHLLRMGTVSGANAAKRRVLLETILSEGHLRSEIIEQFGVRSLASDSTFFVSRLYYLGMLTLGASPRNLSGYDLEIPNHVILEFLRKSLQRRSPRRGPKPRDRELGAD